MNIKIKIELHLEPSELSYLTQYDFAIIEYDEDYFPKFNEENQLIGNKHNLIEQEIGGGTFYLNNTNFLKNDIETMFDFDYISGSGLEIYHSIRNMNINNLFILDKICINEEKRGVGIGRNVLLELERCFGTNRLKVLKAFPLDKGRNYEGADFNEKLKKLNKFYKRLNYIPLKKIDKGTIFIKY